MPVGGRLLYTVLSIIYTRPWTEVLEIWPRDLLKYTIHPMPCHVQILYTSPPVLRLPASTGGYGMQWSSHDRMHSFWKWHQRFVRFHSDSSDPMPGGDGACSGVSLSIMISFFNTPVLQASDTARQIMRASCSNWLSLWCLSLAIQLQYTCPRPYVCHLIMFFRMLNQFNLMCLGWFIGVMSLEQFYNGIRQWTCLLFWPGTP